MDYLHQMIKFDKNLPIKLLIVSINQFDLHWHEESEIILIIEGSIKIGVRNKIHTLKQNDFILINSNELHNFSATNENNLLLILQFNTKHYLSLYPKLNKMIFDCNSSLNTIDFQEKFDLLRYHMARIVLELGQKSNGYQFIISSEVHLLLKDIIQNFQYSFNNSKNIPSNEITLLKIKNILEFINKNFTRKISLQEIAEKEKYSSTYMCRFIKKNLGMSFYDYLQEVRIHKACTLMICSNASLTEIAYQCGFPNYKSFYLLTKKTCGCTPEEYRNDNTNEINESIINKTQHKFIAKEYLCIDKKVTLKKLFDYFEPWNNKILKSHDMLIYSNETITVNAKGKGKNYCKYWNKLITFNRASDGLRREFQNQLEDLQSSISFEYIRFHGIFSDDMMIYNFDQNGEISCNWSYVDELFDFFKKVEIKPFIELEFTPSEFKINNEVVFQRNSNFSFPKYIDWFTKLVKVFIEHCINRYSLKEVETWYFDVCTRPNLEYTFGQRTKEYCFAFYEATVLSLKSVSNNLKIASEEIPLYAKNMPEFHRTEWTKTSCNPNWVYDTCFIAPYIINNALRTLGNTNSLSYQAFTDINKEEKLGISAFHGGYGLINKNGLRKPSFYAYCFLSELGNQIIKQGDGYIITKTDTNIQILIYNYVYFDSLFLSGDTSALTQDERYLVFEKKSAKEIQIKINGLSGKYKFTRFQLNRDSGSVFDDWLKMGAPENMNNHEVTYLKGIAVPKVSIKHLNIAGSYNDKFYLPVHGVDLITLTSLES